ncbi:unnamed protein product [Plutella xylostella]|uniref:ubiquitinyl hydrolase 1 n=1 Tax=Plutella xylostella TaxID=51655 RepID=A0A8S4F9F7_PLUXY|nr:unnamed protein product [Plutella xylostella]
MDKGVSCDHLNKLADVLGAELWKSKEVLACLDCGCPGPNLWICLQPDCHHVGCSEVKNDHSTIHQRNFPSHCVHMNVSTERVWCYACEREVHIRAALSHSRSSPDAAVGGSSSRLGFDHTVAMNVSIADEDDEAEDTDYGEDDERPRGLVGLQNMGNTCYMNAALQALGHLPPLAGYFLHCAPAVALLAGDKKPGLSRAYQKLIKEMWSRKTRGYVVPSGILYGIRNVHGMFRGYQQHDTQEFLRCFLDQLHEELKEPVYDDASQDKLNTEDGDHTVSKNVHMRRRAASSGASDAPIFARMRRKSPAPSSYSERTDGYFRVHSTSESGAAPRAATRHRRSASFAGTQQASYYTHVANGEKEHSRVDIGSESSLSCSSDAEDRYETCSSASDSQLPHTKELPGCGGDGGGARYRSVVSDVFDGKLLSSVQCLICNRVSTRVETFQDLSLPIPSREHLSVLRAQQHALATQMSAPEHDSWLWWVLGWLRSWFYGPVVSLQDCLAAFFSADELKGDNMYSCSRCSKLRNGVKISRLVRLPEVVCIHLKRFRHELAYSSKLAAAVTFPTTSLDLAPYRHPRDFNMPCISWEATTPTILKRGPIEIQEAALNLTDNFSMLGMSQYNTLKNTSGNTLDLAFSTLPLAINRCDFPFVKEDRHHPSFTVEVLDLKIVPLKDAPTTKPNFHRGDYQHGFLRKRSTVTNLASFSNFLLNNMDHGGQVDVIYTDFEKAFDRVDHTILLHKLQILGIHGDLLRWIKSYLTNRSQAVVLGGFRSNFVGIPSGVPQGSHLGPLFYNAYLFDIDTAFTSSKHLLYADDKKIFYKIRNLQDHEAVQADLDALYRYYLNNKITVNVKKCMCISFTRKPKPSYFNYAFNGNTIERVNSVRDLGIILDSKFLLSEHIDHIANKAYRNLGFVLRSCKPFTNIGAIKSVYYAYVRSTLEYASTIWSPHYTIYKERLEKVQKVFINHLNFRLRNSANSYKDGCRINNVNTLEERRTLLDMCFLHDLVHGRVDCAELVVPPHATHAAAAECTSKITRYSLAAVICHSGTAGGGHYTCAALNDNQWYSFDDASVSRVTHAQLAAHEAYVLFYRKVNPEMEAIRRKVAEIIESTPVDPNEVRYYISKQWIVKFNTWAEPGPIDNSVFVCPHGAVRPERARRVDALAAQLAAPAWRLLYRTFGGGPACTRIVECGHCARAAERLRARRGGELAAFYDLHAIFQEQERPRSVYAISMHWFRQWQAFVRSKTREPPPPVDNNGIVTKQETDGVTTFVLKQGSDHAQLSEELWRFFTDIYGGGPEVRLSGPAPPRLTPPRAPPTHPPTNQETVRVGQRGILR